MDLPVLVHQDEDGVFIGRVPFLQGVHSFGATKDELYKNIIEAIELYFEIEDEKNIPYQEIITPNYTLENIHLSYAKTQNRLSKKTLKMA